MAKVSMPQLGESVTEGTIGRWLKQPGETVEKYEPLVEVTTDKVNAEVPSPFAGTLQEITAQEGQTVDVGTLIAIIAAEGEEAGAEGAAVAAVPEPVAVTNQAAGEGAGPTPGPAGSDEEWPESGSDQGVVDTVAEASTTSEAEWPLDRNVTAAATTEPNFGSPTGGEGGAPSGSGAGGTGGRRRFTPLVLRLADQNNIPLEELGRIEGTGLGGRVSKNDVLAYIEGRRTVPQPAVAAPAPAVAPATAPTPMPAPTPARGAAPAPAPVAPAPAPAAPLAPAASAPAPAVGEVVPLTPMRRAIAEHMVRSLATSPHAWTTVEIDVTALARYRAAKKDEFARREGFALSYVPFFIEAVVAALKEFPILNSSFVPGEGGGVQIKREINVGLAVALEGQAGLVVPVIKGADERNIVGLARAVNDVVGRARAGKLGLDDMQGGTFTVNNPGTFGSILSQPIINQPQAAILTMEAIVKRPVVITDPTTETDMIAIRQMMNACISFDHRVLDGLTAGQFLASIKRRLEGFADSPGL